MNEFKFNITTKRAEFLNKLGLKTPFQVLSYLPRKYVDYTLTTQISNLDNDKRVVICGEVVSKERLFRIKRNLNRFAFKVAYLDDEYKVVVFNRDFYYANILVGSKVLVAGKLDYYHREIMASDLFIKELDTLQIKPVYSLIQGVKDYEFAKVVNYCYDQLVAEEKLMPIIPAKYSSKYKLIGRDLAYYLAHFPRSMNDVVQAKRYLKYEEALVYSLLMQKLRSVSLASSSGVGKNINQALLKKIIDTLPYLLTPDQQTSLAEILLDLQLPKTMYRLLQGDVGSGKTIVATLALVACISGGYQGAFMAPTDILARQHYATLSDLLTPFGIQTVLLVSSLSIEEKRQTLKRLQNGEAQLVIGTQALIQKGVEFHNLGMCVVDELQRFGVEQRKLLHEKGTSVDLLLMSATPIPRTLAIAIFQDMDVSTLQVSPYAQKDIQTEVIKGNSITTIKTKMLETLAKDEKIYVVCSLIENELSDYNNVKDVFKTMQKEFVDIPVFLLHGRLKEEEKVAVMAAFKQAKKAILVSTTVIEVGIDIKEATMMIIYDANCFGLAQLHQLRGRIGRGGQKAACYLLTNSNDEEVLEKLTFLQHNSDGFEVARYDLMVRGPGDIAGYAQSGGFGFAMCNIFEDLKIFECARADAKAILQEEGQPANQAILTFLTTYMAKDVAVIE